MLDLNLVHSEFGLILRAIREHADRTRFFGYYVASYETMIFCISAALAGWSGMLYTLVPEFAFPHLHEHFFQPGHCHLMCGCRA
jgi:urea transport system permease protein